MIGIRNLYINPITEDGGDDGDDGGEDEGDAGWTRVTKDVKIAADLQQNKLQIKSSAVEGGMKYVYLLFYGEDGWLAGGFDIWFYSPVKYWISFCESEYYDFSTTLPTDVEKVWSIAKVGTMLNVECNGVLVVEFDTSQCDSYWEREIKQIEFDSVDDASEHYQIVSQGKANGDLNLLISEFLQFHD